MYEVTFVFGFPDSVQLTHDTAMLVKYADGSIKKLRQQGRRLSQVRQWRE